MASQIGRIYIPVGRHEDISNRSVLLTYQLRRCDGISAWSRTFKQVTQISQFFFRQQAVRFYGISVGSVSFRYQLIHRYNVSKILVSFSYQLWRLCNVVSWSVSLRYQLVHRYDVSDWSVLFTNQWDIDKTSQIAPSHWRSSCDVMMASQHGPWRPDLYET